MASFDELLDHIDQPKIDGDPARDILRLAPDLTQDEALKVQLAVKRRHAAQGDPIVGHQASFTTPAARRMFPDGPLPMVGTILKSILHNDGDEVVLDADESFIECEIGLFLKHDLEGPDLTPADVLRAIDCFVPAIEVAPLRPGALEFKYSYQHMIAVQKAAGGYIILGSRHTATSGIDLALEGCVVSVDGRQLAGATGFDAMGNPLNVVAAMAAKLHRIGEKLLAGQVIITGALPAPPRVSKGHRTARGDYTNLGSVTVRFA